MRQLTAVADELDPMDLPPLDTPVLKVSRPVAACSRCRNAKIKCDGKLPACTSCEKNGRAAECTSTNDQFARGKERSYVSTLETRIERLEAKVAEAKARKPSVIDVPEEESATAAPSRRPSRQVNPGEPPTPTTSRLLQRKEVTAIDDLVSDFGFLSVNATARDFYGFTTAMSYARLVLCACSKDELPKGTSKALPPRHEATTLIQYYLDNVFILLPAFDEATFYTSVDNVYMNGLRAADGLDHYMVRMVLAIASAAMSEQRGDQHSMDGIGHVCAALAYAEAVLHPGNISGVQALILLSEYAMLDPHHFDSWSLIGAASRSMADLGLHQDPPKGTPMPRGKLELRRRVFHCVYTLDRSTSLVQSRAFSFSDDSAKVKVPFHKQPTSQPGSPASNGPQAHPWMHTYEAALDLINFRNIQSKWYAELFQSGRVPWDDPYPFLWDTCDEMRKWYENIAPNTSESLKAFFHLDLLYSRIYVLSPSPRVPKILPFAQKLIFEYCIQYAESMIRLISDPAYTAPLTFYDAMRVYMTGRQFLDVLQHNTDLLLSGMIPAHPDVKPTTAPPPPMPVPALPPGETVQRFHTVRSITCIQNITDCLARFGVRWGFMSWNQRYQNETAAVLEDLQRRLQEYDEEASKVRKASVWGSVSSVPSSTGSFSYYSPEQQRVSQASMSYANQHPQSSPPGMQQSGSYTNQQHVSPPQYNQRPPMQQYPSQTDVQYTQPQQAYQQAPVLQQQNSFTFTEPAYNQTSRQPAFSTAPNHQFAAWAGYGGPSAPDTLDEENATSSAMLPPSRPTLSENSLSAAGIPPQVPGQAPPSPRMDTSRAGPSRQSELVSPTHVTADEQRASLGLAPVDSNHTAMLYRLGTHRTSIVPSPVGARMPRGSLMSGIEFQDPERRTSMQDAAMDVLQSTYPPNLPTGNPTAHPGNALPSLTSQRAYVGKGKGRADAPSITRPATGPPAQHAPQAPTASSTLSAPPAPPTLPTPPATYDRFGKFWFYGPTAICMLCNRICHQPEMHRTMTGGGGCVDIGMPNEPWPGPQIAMPELGGVPAGHRSAHSVELEGSNPYAQMVGYPSMAAATHTATAMQLDGPSELGVGDPPTAAGPVNPEYMYPQGSAAMAAPLPQMQPPAQGAPTVHAQYPQGQRFPGHEDMPWQYAEPEEVIPAGNIVEMDADVEPSELEGGHYILPPTTFSGRVRPRDFR